MSWFLARTIVEARDVSDSVDEYARTFTRFEEAYNALKWLLARRCQNLGLRRPVNGVEFRLYVQGSDDLARTPSITVLYTYTDDEVTIFGLQAQPCESEEE